MYRHALAKCRHFLWECSFRLVTQAGDPEFERLPSGREQALPLFRLQLVSECNGRQLCRMQNLVRVGIADTAQHSRVSEGPLERAVLRHQCGLKRLEAAREDVYTSCVHRLQAFFAQHDVQRCAPLRSSLGQYQRAVREIECSQILSTG